MSDYYRILNVSPNATAEEIKNSHHQLALKFHPDKAGPEGEAHFKEIQKAYEVLSSPEKRKLYDRYGAAALENPVADTFFMQTSASLGVAILAVFSFLAAALCIIFIAFLTAYVDGHLPARDASTVDDHSRAYWNYVKVFAPIFVVAIVLGVGILLIIVVSLCSCNLTGMLYALNVLCYVIAVILVPIVKDANDDTALRGGSDYYSWRVWLTPLYIGSSLSLLLFFFLAMPTRENRERLAAYGAPDLWGFTKASYVLGLLRMVCLVSFSALIACRADDVITTNYFVVVGLPFFVFGVLMLIKKVYLNVVVLSARGVPVTFCTILLSSWRDLLLLVLAFASISMVSKRLNDISRADGGSVLRLAIALIPVYILLGVLFLAALVFVCVAIMDTSGLSIFPEAEAGENDTEEEADGRAGEPHDVAENNKDERDNEHHEATKSSEDKHEGNFAPNDDGGRSNRVDQHAGNGNGEQAAWSTKEEGAQMAQCPPQRRLSDVD
ncbi:putative DnaJ chaperone protein [Trypanosoma grayi]|uniref:putative DnaJ chaperone protein n=1 Tax=Trypanosoma grayi TaxID=71804 RepID=UPI0004F44FD3|nr:putative DnaJ chaperone protein [Trypanosoma grayi]KEG10984.1 putative DnaJ chaperone protein [Trypanosoma grayi]